MTPSSIYISLKATVAIMFLPNIVTETTIIWLLLRSQLAVWFQTKIGNNIVVM